MAKKSAILSPDKDAGWGLIYRLNNLWAQVDPKATGGDYEGWNFVLDRIYCNLLYEDNMIITRVYECDKGHRFLSVNERKECPRCREETKDKVPIDLVGVKRVKLSNEDEMIYEHLTKKITTEKNNIKRAIKKQTEKSNEKLVDKSNGKNLEQSKEDYYRALMMKDIWLRKFMQGKGLYLKVLKSDPSRALFGGG